MINRELEIFLKDDKKLIELFNGEKSFIQFDKNEFYLKPFAIKKPNNFIFPQSYPDCCEYHKGIPKYIENWFNQFPDCCKRHKKYKNLPWFAKEQFLDVPEKIRIQLLYTEFHIQEHIEDVDWYKKITDYLEYNVRSFGSPEVGADRYYKIIEHYIKYTDTKKSKISKNKRKLLLEYFNREKEDKKEHKTDLNTLKSIFDKWVKTIPNISLFKCIKEKVANRFPINLILYNGEYNLYLKETKFRTRTRSELISILVQITKDTLLSISNDPDKKNNSEISELVLLEESHLLKQNRLLQEYSKGEIKYIKVIKQWLKNESQFFIDFKALEDVKQHKKQILINNFKNEYKEISKKISNNDIEGALKEIKNVCDNKSDLQHILKQVIHHLGRHRSMKERFDLGIAKNEDFTLENNRIRMATIDLLFILQKSHDQ